jgi:hypothetical protein
MITSRRLSALSNWRRSCSTSNASLSRNQWPAAVHAICPKDRGDEYLDPAALDLPVGFMKKSSTAIA